MHPGGCHVILRVISINNRAKKDGKHCCRCHDAPVELAFHDFKAFFGSTIFSHGVMDIEAGQVKKCRKPANDRNNMKSLEPEHLYK